MGSLGILGLAVIVLWVQAFSCSYCEEDPPCRPGFSSETFIFKVHRTHLQKGRRLGRVLFDDCSGRQRALFYAQDTRFNVDTDGTVSLKRPVNLYDGHKSFSVHAWDSKGKKFTTRVWVQYEPSTIHQQEVDTVAHEQSDSTPSVPVLDLPWSSSGLKRRKRDWIIPPIKIQENQKGPFPKPVVKIRSSNDKEAQMLYSITGQGADQPPKGLFTMDKNSGQLFVTQPLDREKQASYTLVAHSVAVGAGQAEEPMEIIIEVIDMNDNKPVFTQTTFEGSVPEAAREGYDILIVTATDADDPSTHNGELVYNILSQEPVLPKNNMFAINPTSGQIRLSSTGLDREKYPQYTLTVEATDLAGEGFSTTCRVIIKVTDSNDNAPQFEQTSYTVSVPENKIDAEVVKMKVTDGDEPYTAAWYTKFKIVQGDTGGFFNISTGPNGLEGIITTAKGLDFEKRSQYILVVTVENSEPFSTVLPTSTATVTVNVEDVNEAPVFNPSEIIVNVPENEKVGERLVTCTATDPDTQMKQSIEYKLGFDPAGWLSINKSSGAIFVKSPMDKESSFVVDGKYRVPVFASDNAAVPATGTGTLVVSLKDVNDNAPTIDEREIKICNQDPEPVLLSVSDKDGPGFGAPYRVELHYRSLSSWTARMNEARTGIILNLKTKLPQDKYNVILRVFDVENIAQDNTILAFVCDCKGKHVTSDEKYVAGVTHSNDNAPQFPRPVYLASVPEHKKDAEVARMFVYDNNDPLTPAWFVKFHIIHGNEDGFFKVTNGPCHMEGVITTVKALDFEKKHQHTLLVTVENQIPLTSDQPTATATVIVNVEDENEA